MLITLGFLPDKVGSWCLGGEQTTRGQTVLPRGPVSKSPLAAQAVCKAAERGGSGDWNCIFICCSFQQSGDVCLWHTGEGPASCKAAVTVLGRGSDGVRGRNPKVPLPAPPLTEQGPSALLPTPRCASILPPSSPEPGVPSSLLSTQPEGLRSKGSTWRQVATTSRSQSIPSAESGGTALKSQVRPSGQAPPGSLPEALCCVLAIPGRSGVSLKTSRTPAS